MRITRLITPLLALIITSSAAHAGTRGDVRTSRHSLEDGSCRGFYTTVEGKQTYVCELGPNATVRGYLAEGDELRYAVTVPANHLVSVLAEFPDPAEQNLILWTHGPDGDLIQARYATYPYPDWISQYETKEEGAGFLALGERQTYYMIVKGQKAEASGEFALTLNMRSWRDGLEPIRSYQQTTAGSAESTLVHFPMTSSRDSYLKAAKGGFAFDTMSNYRYIRPDLLQLIRYAVHEVAGKFPGTNPLGIGDVSDRYGRTPALDVGFYRHPETTHDQGIAADIAYYQENGDNRFRVVCDKDGTENADGTFCLPSAAETHIVDLQRTAYFIAMLLRSERVRVIGVDAYLGPVIQAEVKRLYEAGHLTEADWRAAESMRFYWGPGWPYHHHHLHVALWP